MALVIHELVTNSTKYGSLSGTGEVHIEWVRDQKDNLVITWQEVGGPPVKAPTRKGFGTTIVNRSVPYDLGGQAKIDYAVDGVRAEFSIPSRHVSEPRSFAGPEIHVPKKNSAYPVSSRLIPHIPDKRPCCSSRTVSS